MGSEIHPQTIAVIGAGTMGAGIAQVAASHGCWVHLIDINLEVLQRGLGGIKKNLDRLVEKGKLSLADREAVTSRIEPSDAIRGIERSELVIEAVIEDLAIKQGIFRQLDTTTRSEAVLATNTSSLSVSKIAEVVRDPSRVVGMHFFNPAPLMPLVEVVAGRLSDRRAIDFAVGTAKAWGKTPVVAKDTPGFIVNRVARGYYLEALRLLGEGVAGVDEIDNIMRVHGGFKMGPFELMDLVGLDVNLAVSTSVWEQMNKHPRFTPHDIQKKLVVDGNLGRKSGRGFYLYAYKHPLPAYVVDRRSFQLSLLLGDAVRTFAERAGTGRAGITEQYIFSRIMSAILNEAGYAFCENVATREDIDVAMIKGTNYPKGPLAWAEEIGHRTVRGLLRRLNESAGDGRYEPAAALAEC
jgi:3-hydroxybutyryl-CoA dehydrogenase